ncbi:bacillithiol biosynthesis deacetylase BshB1 [Fuchsiella alkaliacetigena]|uniref:bacillithiol biosynthesis deacetylase BshB1 n=1 Tax=Fuchsiella alkaliacetigena TaxID=957042 RepID=UPI00200AACE6|nr:bacillithiol biosynthesis deacetylase BshB1 [Fuchsiella alkaliacetigena]MCK8824069.1 bacillithiol biosynthesis deacetylase BshB1 [Fuchsiella alkaliacetigena]
MKIDLLAFGAHPDDVEIGAGGVLINHAQAGHKTAVVDLTAGEMGSNGTAEIRSQEAQAAAEIMELEFRDCLGLPDSRLRVKEEYVEAVVEVIRSYRPQVVLAPYWRDRHPDHEQASRLVTEACHKAGLKNFPGRGAPYRPQALVYYFLSEIEEVDFAIDISEQYQQKMEALFAHSSQFNYSPKEDFKTVLNDSSFINQLESRFRYLGSLIKSKYAEGFKYKQMLELKDLLSLEGGV